MQPYLKVNMLAVIMKAESDLEDSTGAVLSSGSLSWIIMQM